VKKYLGLVYDALVVGQQKAVIGFLVSGIVSLCLLIGISGDMTVREAVSGLVTGLLTGISVWLKTNK